MALADNTPSEHLNFRWDDALRLDTLLTQEERMVSQAARDYARGELL
ncbi:MAG: hypothetical protein HLUCCA04_06560, partial [Oceanicaulis sp. HLUCCA04]